MAVGEYYRPDISRGAAELGHRALDARPAPRPAGVDERELAVLLDQVPVDETVGEAMDAGGDLLGRNSYDSFFPLETLLYNILPWRVTPETIRPSKPSVLPSGYRGNGA